MRWFSRKKDEPQERVEPQMKVVRRPSKLKQRSFNASMMDRLNHSWTASSESADHVVFNSLKIIRARAREQLQNNDYVKRFVSIVKTNVIGPKGVQLQSQAIGRDGKADKIAQDAIERTFKLWAKKQNCDLKGALSWREIQNIVIGTVAIDGEIFIRTHAGGPYGLYLELIDPELVDVTYFDRLKNGNYVQFGIEYNNSGRAVAYHVIKQDNSVDLYGSEYHKKEYTRVPAAELNHIFLTEIVGQKRGLPWVATGLQRLKLLQGYEDAALVAVRVGASKMGFFTSETGEVYEGAGVDEDGNIYEEAEPGTFGELPPGVKFESFDPDYPKGEFADFMKQALRGLSSGLSVSYNTLANDLEGVNFSSMRHGAIEERQVWLCLQEWLIESLIEPVVSDWIERQYYLATITIPVKNGPGKPLSRQLANYMPVRLQARRWEWMDPLKDIQAKVIEVKLGVNSPSAIIRDRAGDVDQLREELAADLKWMKENDLALDEVMAMLMTKTEEEDPVE